MNIFVYSDESGVFDKLHNEYFVFGGLILLGKEKRDIENRKYIHVENNIRKKMRYSAQMELKASQISNKDKYNLYRSLGSCMKFGAVVRQNQVLDRIFQTKKDKQRYLDYVYKISLKRALTNLINEKIISSDKVENIYVFADEHSTATNGIYELQEALEQEFKNGTYNYDYRKFFPPLFQGLESVTLKHLDSNNKPLIRAADIVANKIYHDVLCKQELKKTANLHITYFP